jgi:hypothetical protein
MAERMIKHDAEHASELFKEIREKLFTEFAVDF